MLYISIFFQDGIDLILGNYHISVNDKVSPLQVKTGYKYLAVRLTRFFFNRYKLS